METSAVLLVCILVTHSGVFGQVPAVCNACKEALKRAREEAGENASKEVLKSKLLTACDNVDYKTLCKKFIKIHLNKLIERLQTNDDVETICDESDACKNGYSTKTWPPHRIVILCNDDAQNQTDFP